jgi:predicted transcriptional regulator
MAKDRELPPPLEMACLNALWELGEGNVEEVRVCVSRARPLAYTTVLTLLDRLSRRGAVSRRKEGRGFRYQPAIERDKLRQMALVQFLELHFDGSANTLQRFLEIERVRVPAEVSAPEAHGETDSSPLAQGTWPGDAGPRHGS